MGERYELKGKIGQGGLGAVYKAYDTRMSRDVAIKRIIANASDNALSEEATRQLIKEAGALSALQHPNIVTIYDVGTDDDGPFVVMELLSGQTLDDLVMQGSFTWPDFRQFAMQVLEAMIAAQDLTLVHRDLKPTNIMVTWLPSGKFQVKIVDFGLAKLSAAPTLQTVDQHDGVFGSIYFMAPEQFERVPISSQVDIYAIGCVFYYALTGTYPFDGDTAATVMASHLQHHVTPLQEVREGIPVWACDWVMWHLNRFPGDRPESARQALQYFVDNDTLQPNPILSTGLPSPTLDEPKRPKLVIPGAAATPKVITELVSTQPIKTAVLPKPILPPDGSKPSVHTSAQIIQPTSSTEPVISDEPTPPPVAEKPAPPAPVLAAQPIPSPRATSSQIPVANTRIPTPTQKLPTPTQKLATAPPRPTQTTSSSVQAEPVVEPQPVVPEHLLTKKTKSISPLLKVIIAVILGIIVAITSCVLVKRSRDNARIKLYNEMIVLARNNSPVPVDKEKLGILLDTTTSIEENNDRDIIFLALTLAISTDKTDIDATIINRLTEQKMTDLGRKTLLEILGKRNNPSIVSQLISFSNTTTNKEESALALNAIRDSATEFHMKEIISKIKTESNASVLTAAENVLSTIISKNRTSSTISDSIFGAYNSSSSDVARHTFLRLIGLIGGAKAMDITKQNLNSDKITDQFAAIATLTNIHSQESLTILLQFLPSIKPDDAQTRKKTFQAMISIAKQLTTNEQKNWEQIASAAKTREDLGVVINALASSAPPQPWNIAILQKIATTHQTESVKERAAEALDTVKDRAALEEP